MVTYRGPGPWGAGKGSNLTAAEFDGNTYQLLTLVNAKAAQGVGIQSITIVGDQMWVALTDSSILGPYTLPVSTISFVGEWAPSTVYYVNQILTAGGKTYIVMVNHTSALTFDPGANDGHGNDYYGLLLDNPAAMLPSGGAVGMVLEKPTTVEYSSAWVWPTLAGLHDVLPSPAPVTGQLVYWAGSAFGYLDQASVVGAVGALRNLSDVLASPGPTSGQLVYWNGTKFSYLPQASVNAANQPKALAGLSDVLASPAPTSGQVVYWNGSNFTYRDDGAASIATLSDVLLTSLAQWDGLTYDLANTRWENRQPYPYDSGWAGTFSLALSHAQELVDITTGGTITIEVNATIAFAKGAAIWIRQKGALSSPFSVAAAGGVTLNIPAGRLAQPRALASIVMLQQTSTLDTWEISGDLAFDTATNVLATTGTIAMDTRTSDNDVYTWTPAGSQTINHAAVGASGKKLYFVVTTSGTSSFTLTFGTHFKTTGTLATGVVSAKVFTLAFIGDGTNFNEVSRTTAM